MPHLETGDMRWMTIMTGRKMFRQKKTREQSTEQYQPSDHTFVVCAYKESPYLEECVRSCLRQKTKTNVRIATSTPNKHIQKVANRYHIPLDIRDSTKAKGIAEDWNFALRSAHTPLVTIAHQDDIYGASYSQMILRYLNRCHYPLIAFSDYAELRGESTITVNQLLMIKRSLLIPLIPEISWRSIFIRRSILSLGSAICCPAVTLVRDHLTEPVFENNMRSNIDWQAWEKLSRQKGEFVYIPQVLMKHRIHEGSATSELIGQKGRRAEDIFMYRKFWPKRIAMFIEHFYQKGEESNSL